MNVSNVNDDTNRRVVRSSRLLLSHDTVYFCRYRNVEGTLASVEEAFSSEMVTNFRMQVFLTYSLTYLLTYSMEQSPS